MRNLNLLNHQITHLPTTGECRYTLDSITPNQFYTVNADKLLTATEKGVKSEFEVRDVLPNTNTSAGFEYLALNDEFCVASDTTLLVYNPNISPHIAEEVTFFEHKIICSAWSPDQEILAIITEDLRCIVLNSMYTTLSDTNLIESGFGEDEFVNVGWGKKETQFHGSEGKQAARKIVETGAPIAECVDARCEVSWRGDGSYFVVLFSYENKRLFKVFDKEGQLKFTSERCHGLDGPVAWRPSGLWIAVPQLLIDDKYCIALFERNGLRHRELLLPFSRSTELVTQLSWSYDSEVLSIVTRILDSNVYNIYLYTINNYHWYLKQSLSFTSPVKCLKWDPHPVNGKTMHVFLADGEYHKFKWCFSVSKSRGSSNADEAVVAVIDGHDLLLTNFRSFVIPPPMSSFKLTIDQNINGVGFIENYENRDPNQFFIVTESLQLKVYQCVFETANNGVTKNIKEVQLLGEIEISGDLLPFHWRLIDETTLVYTTGQAVHLISTKGKEMDKITMNNQSIVALKVVDMASIFIGLLDGAMVKVELNLQDYKFRSGTKDLFPMSTLCEQHEVVVLPNEDPKVFSLNPGEMLYLNGVQHLGDITSMLRIGNYLAVTTVDELKFINLVDKNSVSERKIERGGLLITIVPNDSRTVLQMPRGNLETIKPRTLSIGIIGRLLDDCEYGKCYDILRRERINLNIIVDHNPDKFFANMSTFIDQVNNPNWLNLFLAELRNEDVTQTIYQQQYGKLVSTSGGEGITPGYNATGKIQFICERFCEMVEKTTTGQLGNAKWLTLPKITSYVKRGDLETALGIIWQLKCSEESDGSTAAADVSADDALKYLLYLVNVDELFNVALGMYDFDLVLFVARKSQKDPKEYLPFMNGLKQLKETYRKFQIDLHLKRYKKAVVNGLDCDSEHFEECLKVIKDHGLYNHAMEAITNATDERYLKIAFQYGDYLREKGRLKEAGYMYERSGDLPLALSCAQKSLQWRRCISLKRQLGADEQEVKQLAENMVTLLADKGQYSDAVEVCSIVLKDTERQFKLLIEGNLFERALYESRSENDRVVIKEAFEGFWNSLLTSIEEDSILFRKQKQRLLQVRKEKVESANNPESEFNLDCDLYSDTTSLRSSQHTGGTRGTGKSFRSSKNRRKHERKLLNLKEGNVFEDIALIDSLHGLVTKITNQQNVVKETLQAAVALNLTAAGRKLQRFYKDLLEEVRNSLDAIWIPEMIVSEHIVLSDELDLAQLQKDQHLALIKPNQRYKPQMPSTEWEFEILK